MKKIKYCTVIEFLFLEGLNTKQIHEQLLEVYRRTLHIHMLHLHLQQYTTANNYNSK